MATADRKLWLTADKETVVEDGDPKAAFLLASPGDELSDDDVKRYGIKVKQAAPAEDKQAEPAEDKADSGSGLKVTKAAKKAK